MSFESWLANLLRQDECEVQCLLEDKTALHFLIAWSLFESKCFAGSANQGEIEKFSERIVAESFKTDSISKAVAHFHVRYQDEERFDKLMYGKLSLKMTNLLKLRFDSLQPQDMVFLAAFTAFRFRNNIFHGNKGIVSWLNFTQQIDYCIEVMMAFVIHKESVSPSLPERLPLAA